MSDPNDIDAREATPEELLLVDLLYGELEGEAEAQARARLEGDESMARELETYGELRAMLRELPEDEPPQAVSARLLHAAAEAAPKKRATAIELGGEPGLWARVLQFFRPLVANPAFAAAAMLVLVAGVAGALYLGGNVEVSRPTATSDRADEAPPAAAAPQSPAMLDPTRSEDSAEGRGATLADEKADLGIAEEQQSATEGEDRAREASKRPAESLESKPAKRVLDFDKNTGDSKPKAEPAKPTVTAPAPTTGTSTRGSASPGGSVSGKAGSGGLIDADDESGGDAVTETAKPDAPAEPAPAPPPAPRDQTVQQEKDTASESASALHQRAVRAAADGECDAVRALATRIRGVDAGYYDKLVRGDKRLGSCLNAPSKIKK